MLVLIGALEDGTKELLAVVDGYRESTQSWRELLQQLKRQGLQAAPKLAIGDGSLGFWLALREETDRWPKQRCWVHKTANILDKMPKSVQGRAKQLVHEMYLSPTRKAALAAYDHFQLPGQVSKRDRVPGKGQRMAVHLLRLSGPTLLASAHYQSH